jgi:hypothetical protein
MAGDHTLAAELVARAESQAQSVPLLPQEARDVIAVTRATARVDPDRALELAGHAEAMLRRITEPDTQLKLLSDLVKAAQPASSGHACQLAREFTRPHRRASVMSRLAGAAADAGHPELALDIARSIRPGRNRALALVACARKAPTGTKAAILLAEAQQRINGGSALPDILAAAVACDDDELAEQLYRRARSELVEPGDARALLRIIEAARDIDHPGRMARLQADFAEAATNLRDPIERMRTTYRLVRGLAADRIHDSVRKLIRVALTETTDARPRAIFELAFAGLAGPGAPDTLPPPDELDDDDLRIQMECVTCTYGPRAAHLLVRAIRDEARRDLALRAVIGEVLQAAAQPDTLTQAYLAARDLASLDHRAEDLTRLARHAPPGWAEATECISHGMAAASEVPRAERRGRLLAELAAAAASRDMPAVADKAIDASLRATEEVTDPEKSAGIFGALAVAAGRCGESARAAELLARAVSCAPLARADGWSDDGVEQLARAVAKTGDVDHAAVLARILDDRPRAARLLQTLANLAFKAGEPVRAKALADLVEDPASRVRGLTSLICAATSAGSHAVADSLLGATLTALHEMTDVAARDAVAPGLVTAAAEAEHDDRAAAVLASITDAQQRDVAVLGLVRVSSERGDTAGARKLATQLTDPALESRELSALDGELPEVSVDGEAAPPVPEPDPTPSAHPVSEPDSRRAVAAALLNGNWTAALPRLARIDSAALFDVAQDILSESEPTPVPAR